ncbi:MAG: phenylalanine--tRNA ligase subunit beta [Acidimicrobiia bacterium]|nr:phenylalanine--tRNA ligase subunit beta [Acidimicrobiia bacterium]
MKLTRRWLEEFVAIPVEDPEQLVEDFENLGHEIESWHVIEPAFRGVVVGRVLEVAAHPNADKVRLTKVDVGTEVLDIICGAWNFEAGAVVPVAIPGAVLGDDFEITRREIRGVVSNGMSCSEIELGLGEEADGIMVLNVDYPDAAGRIGEDFAAVVGLPDVFYEINVTPNRPDCLSVYGLARDLAALYRTELVVPDFSLDESGEPNDVTVTIEAPDLCGRFAGRRVRGVTVEQSPHPIRWRLVQAGVRPISNVVDASNYAMLEFGYPTHAFDVDRLGDTISVRLATEGETVVTLDDQERTLTATDLVVTDGERPVAIGGVMGGASTEVHGGTTDVFIEAAYWDPATILTSSKRLDLRSEASARFERGADPSFCPSGADRVAQLLVAHAGGVAAPSPVDVNPGAVEPWTIEYPLSDTSRTLGVDLDRATTADLLERMSFEVSGDDPLVVTVPTRRPDVQRPIDLVEEIARLHGFDDIPERVPSGTGAGLPAAERRLRLVRDVLVGAGLYQTMTFSFIGEADLDRLGADTEDAVRTAIGVTNPLNDTEGVMRTTLLPGLLKAASTALGRRVESSRLFEMGKVFLPGDGKLPHQPDRLGFVLAGSDGGVGYDIADGTGLWELLASALRIPGASVTQSQRVALHPGRAADLRVGDEVIGYVGEVHPRVADAFGLHGRVVVAEMDVAPLIVDRGAWAYSTPSPFPPVIFDMAFNVASEVAAANVVDAARRGAGANLEDLHIFDVFAGESVGEGKKSIALRFTLRAPDRTLTDEEAAPIRRSIAEAVAADVDGILRGEL